MMTKEQIINEALDDLTFYHFTEMTHMFMVQTTDDLKKLYLSFLKNKYGLDVFDLDVIEDEDSVRVVPNNVATTLAVSDLFKKYKKTIPSKHYTDKSFENKYLKIDGNNLKIKKENK